MTTWIITTNNQIAALVEVAERLGSPTTIIGVGTQSLPEAGTVLSIALPEGAPAEAAAGAVAARVEARPGDVVLVPNRPAERVLAGAVAARLGAPILTGFVSAADDSVELDRFGGITRETVRVRADRPAVIVLPGGAEAPAGQESAPVEKGELLAALVSGESTEEASVADLGSARRIVAVGRGFKTQEDLQLARDLAAALGAELACSRPVAEGVGWMPKESYVGISGQSVQPELYVAVGISGQLQHMAGAKNSRTIVAINSDGDAPIFAHADYGVVGDLYEVVPAVTAALG